MKTVWKFEMKNRVQIEMPKQAKILCIKEVDGYPCVYAEVDTDNSNNREIRTIGVFYTGTDLPEREIEYIDTLVAFDGLVYHFYEILN